MKRFSLLFVMLLPLTGCFLPDTREEDLNSITYTMHKSDVMKIMGKPFRDLDCEYGTVGCPGFSTKDTDPSLQLKPGRRWFVEMYIYRSLNPFNRLTQNIAFDRTGKVVAKTSFIDDSMP